MKRLAIVHTHPIQYNVPLYRLLSKDKGLKTKVFYTWSQTKDGFYDPKFKRYIKWDIPLLEGYEYEFVKNISLTPSSQKFFGIITPQLIKRINIWNADAVFITGWNNYSHLKAMLKFHGKIPVLFRGDSTLLDNKQNFRASIRKFFLTQIYKTIDYALYVGKENKKYFKAAGLKDEQLIYAPHAIENERFFDKNGEYLKEALEWQKRLGIKDKKIKFIYVGKFEVRKNLEILINSFKKTTYNNIILLMIGNGPEEKKLKQIARNDKRIIFLPFQNQSKMPIVYRLGDVLILPSKFETWGLVVNEAMASGLAIITSNKVGCASDLVHIGENGYIFDFYNKNDLTDKLNLIIQKNNIEKMKKNSLRIIKDYSYQEIIKAIKKAIL